MCKIAHRYSADRLEALLDQTIEQEILIERIGHPGGKEIVNPPTKESHMAKSEHDPPGKISDQALKATVALGLVA